MELTAEAKSDESFIMDQWVPNNTVNYFSVPQDELPMEMRYTFTNTVMIAVYACLFLTSLLTNLLFVAILIRRRLRSKTHQLMICLCVSNFYVILLEMPQQIGWNWTVLWTAGDELCRALAYFGTVGLYGSSFFTACIIVDRWHLISKTNTPVSSNGRSGFSGPKRTGVMIGFTWILAHACSIPQAIIFHVEEHPYFKNYHQCVTFGSMTRSQEIVYSIFVSCLIYIIPLLILTFCCIAIWLCVRRHASSFCVSSGASFRKALPPASETDQQQLCLSLSAANRLRERTLRFRCSTKRLLWRAEKQAFRLAVVFLAIFIICHTPFQIASIWKIADPAFGQKINPIVHGLLFACGVLPTIVDPIVYGEFFIPITNELKSIMMRKMKPIKSRERRSNSSSTSNDESAYSRKASNQNSDPGVFVQLFLQDKVGTKLMLHKN